MVWFCLRMRMPWVENNLAREDCGHFHFQGGICGVRLSLPCHWLRAAAPLLAPWILVKKAVPKLLPSRETNSLGPFCRSPQILLFSVNAPPFAIDLIFALPLVLAFFPLSHQGHSYSLNNLVLHLL